LHTKNDLEQRWSVGLYITKFIIGMVYFNIYYLYVYNSTVRVYVTELFLNGRTDLNDFFLMCLSDALDGLNSQTLQTFQTIGTYADEIIIIIILNNNFISMAMSVNWG